MLTICKLYQKLYEKWNKQHIKVFKISVGDPDPDPQIRDPDPRIFTGIQIHKGSAIICHADLKCGS